MSGKIFFQSKGGLSKIYENFKVFQGEKTTPNVEFSTLFFFLLWTLPLPKTKTELSRVAAEIESLPDGRGAAKVQVDVDSEKISVEDR